MQSSRGHGFLSLYCKTTKLGERAIMGRGHLGLPLPLLIDGYGCHLGVGAKGARHRALMLAYGRPPPAHHETISLDGDMECDAMGRYVMLVVPVPMTNGLCCCGAT